MSLAFMGMEKPFDEEWDAAPTVGGGSTVERSEDAAWPELGANGAKFTMAAGGLSYLQKTISGHTNALSVGFHWNVQTLPTDYSFTYVSHLLYPNGSTYVWKLLMQNSGGDGYYFQLYYYEDDGSVASITTGKMCLDRWYHIAIRLYGNKTNGYAKIYINGGLENSATGLDNDTRVATASKLRIGTPAGDRADFLFYLDNVTIDTTITGVRPYRRSAAGLYTEAANTLVLYRRPNLAERDSGPEDFAYYCVNQLGIPRSNLIPLPNAPNLEGLVSQGDYLSVVDGDINLWMGRMTVPPDSFTAFIVSFDTPGFWTRSGTKVTVETSLMYYGGGGYSQTANPLYGRTTRPTRADLTSNNLYLATRIDAVALQQAKDILDAGITVSALSALPSADYLTSDDADTIATLAVQKTRLNRSTTLSDASAFQFGNLSELAASGSRVCAVDDGQDVVGTLRAPLNTTAEAVIEGGFAAACGFTVLPVLGDDGFDVDAFLSVLMDGGTFGEAALCATEHLNGHQVIAGNPLMTVAFIADGYNVYRSETGEIEDLGDTPVAYLQSDEINPTLTGLGHSANGEYLYLVRAQKGGIENPDWSCFAEFTVDDGGEFEGIRPDDVMLPAVERGAAGTLTINFRSRPGGETPDDYAVWHSTTSTVDTSGSPDATLTHTRFGNYSHEFTLSDGTQYWFCVKARITDGASSGGVTIGPFAADSTAPDQPDILTEVGF